MITWIQNIIQFFQVSVASLTEFPWPSNISSTICPYISVLPLIRKNRSRTHKKTAKIINFNLYVLYNRWGGEYLVVNNSMKFPNLIFS